MLTLEEKMFFHADYFREAANALLVDVGQRKKRTGYEMLPVWVMQALTCELFLKCLVAVTTAEKKPTGHLLHKFFDKIPANSQALLIHNYEVIGKTNQAHINFFKATPHVKNDIRVILEGGSEVFQKVRYAYEGLGKQKLINCFPVPILATRKTILDISPSWHSKQL